MNAQPVTVPGFADHHSHLLRTRRPPGLVEVTEMGMRHQAVARRSWWMRAVIQAASGKAEEEPIVVLLATTTTLPVVVWAPIRAAGDLRAMA